MIFVADWCTLACAMRGHVACEHAPWRVLCVLTCDKAPRHHVLWHVHGTAACCHTPPWHVLTMHDNLSLLQAIVLGQALAELGGHKAAGGLGVEPGVVASGEVSHDGGKVDGGAAAGADAVLDDANGHMLHQGVHRHLGDRGVGGVGEGGRQQEEVSRSVGEVRREGCAGVVGE